MKRSQKNTFGKAALAGALAGGAVLLALKLSQGQRRARQETRGKSEAAVLTEKSAEVDGVTMRWLEHGHGQPVVFIHGIPTCPQLWRKVLPRLRGARALAWEMVGYGASIPEGKNCDISVARQADYLLAWLKELGIEQAVFVGHDLGGGVVQIAAVRRPEVCAGLLLTNAIGYDSWPVPSVKLLRAMGGVVRHLPPAAIKLILWTLFRLGHDDQRVAAASGRLHWRNYAQHDAAPALVRQVRSLHVEDTLAIVDALPHLRVPARIVWGAADGFQKVRYGEKFARDLGATLQRIEGGKHFTPEDHPDRIAAVLNSLLEEVGAAEGYDAPRAV